MTGWIAALSRVGVCAPARHPMGLVVVPERRRGPQIHRASGRGNDSHAAHTWIGPPSGNACTARQRESAAPAAITPISLWAARESLPVDGCRLRASPPIQDAIWTNGGLTEGSVGSARPVILVAANASGAAIPAAVGLAAAGRCWPRRRGAGLAGTPGSRRTGRRAHAPRDRRPARGVSIRPPQSPPPRRIPQSPIVSGLPAQSPLYRNAASRPRCPCRAQLTVKP